MGFYKKKIVRVSKGQIAPNLIERTDMGILDASCQELTNWQNSKYGAIKTQLPTTFRYSFGEGKKVVLRKIKLSTNREGFLAFNGTDSTVAAFNEYGEIISNVYNFPQITVANYKDIQVAQNQELILLCTKDNPILRIYIDDLPNLSAEVFSIPASAIMKAANITQPTETPKVYRFTDSILPATPTTYGITTGSLVYINSLTGTPSTSFPWVVYQLISTTATASYSITSIKINNLGSGYQVNDVITVSGATFTITSLSVGADLIINNPAYTFPSDIAGTGVATTGGSGTGLTVDITTVSTTNTWQQTTYTPAELDIVKDTWDNTLWQYVNNAWIKPSLQAVDIHYSTTWKVSANAGVVKVTGSLLATITAPAGFNPEDYAKSLLIGVEFDGENAIGIMVISDLGGTTVGQEYRITSITGTTVITFDPKAVTDNQTGFTLKLSQVKVFDGDYPNTDANPSATTNYPTRILFYQQRLIIVGSRYNLSQLVFSKIGVYNDFTDEKLDNSGFQLIIGSTEKEEILSCILNNGIQLFTSNSEWIMTDQAITRTSGFVRNSQIGTNGVQPIIAANGVTLFPPKNGKGIIGFAYNFETASFMTPYITLFTNLLDAPIVDMILKRGLDSQDDTLIYICDEEGDMIVGNYLQEHDIQAFCLRRSSLAKFEQTLQCEQQVLFLSERNGITSLEIVDETKQTALALENFTYNYNTGVLSIPYTQYDSQGVNIYDENGAFVGTYYVTDGGITFDEEDKPAGISEVGFNIHSVFQSNPQNIGNETKTLYKTIDSIKLAVTPESKTDFLTVNGKYGWRKGNLITFIRPTRPLRDCRFTIENDNYPVEILSMEIEIEA